MQQRGPALVRIALVSLVFGAFAMALATPVQAGTEAAPEIQDPADDQSLISPPLTPCVPVEGCITFSRIDILSVWLDTETATTFNVNIKTTGVPGSPNAHSSRWEFHATFAGTEVVSVASSSGGAAPTAPAAGDNVASVAVTGNTLVMTINKAVYGAPTAGATLTNLFAIGEAREPALSMVPLGEDRAPNTGAGTDYVFTGGAGSGPLDPNDTDGDGLNDTWEVTHFTNVTAQNATGDPDGDGLTNGQEEALGTDPNNPDTDGDGVNDKDDPFPLDPTKGGTSGSSSSSSSSASSSSSSSTSSSSSSSSRSSTSSGNNASGAGNPTDFAQALDRLTTDAGYLGASTGGLVAVLLLAILALAVRWSL